MRKRIRNEGMTLIEVAVVICIISLVSALAIPSVIGFMPRFRLSSQVSALQNDIQRARIKSISLNTIYRMRFFLYPYPTVDRYRGYIYDSSSKTWKSDMEMFDKEINKSVDIAYIHKSAYTSGVYSMYFLADGSCITYDICFTNTLKQEKKISILSSTGFIKVFDNW